MTPLRRHDDTQAEVDAAEVEQFFAELPKVIPALKRGRVLNLSLIVFIIGATLVFGWSFDRAAERDRQDAINTCHAVNDNARKFNELIDTLVLRTTKSPTIPPEQKAEALRLYNAARQTMPVCDPPEDR